MTTNSPLVRRPVSRRWLLAAVPATAVTLAACSSSDSSGSTSTTSTPSSSTTTSTATSATATGAATAGSVAALAQAFYKTLDADLQTAVLLDYSLADAKRWSNLPQGLISGTGGFPGGGDASGAPGGDLPDLTDLPDGAAPSDLPDLPAGGIGGGSSQSRVGVALGDLDDDQLAAFEALLEAATGTKAGLGYDEIQQQLNADDYLAANGGGDTYGRGNFYVALLGSPQDTGTWELQFGGHHLAVANTYVDGVLVGATPAFRGVEPNDPFELDGETNQPLKVKQAAFQAMLAGMSADQLGTAKLSDVYTDLVLGPGQDWAFPTTSEGVQVSTLTARQQKLVLAAVATYTDDVADADAALILARYKSELADTYVAYSGTTALTEQNDYVRVDGPSVWIEFSMQHGIVLSGNHPHSVWRDRSTDYAGTQS